MKPGYIAQFFTIAEKNIKALWNDRITRIFLIKISILVSFGFIIWLIRMNHIEPFYKYANSSKIFEYFKNTLVFFTYLLLKLLGENATFNYQDSVVGIISGRSVFLGIPCYGLKLMGIFAVFIIAYPGKNVYRLLFILSGCIVIQILNVIRLTGLVIIYNYYPQYFNINHHVIFTTAVYIFVFIMWVIWTKIYQKQRKIVENDMK